MTEEVLMEPKVKTLCVPRIPHDLHIAFRKKAIGEGKYIRAAVIEAMKQYVETEYQR